MDSQYPMTWGAHEAPQLPQDKAEWRGDLQVILVHLGVRAASPGGGEGGTRERWGLGTAVPGGLAVLPAPALSHRQPRLTA